MTAAVLDLNTFTGQKKQMYHLKFMSTNNDVSISAIKKAFIYRQSVTPNSKAQTTTGIKYFDFGKQS